MIFKTNPSITKAVALLILVWTLAFLISQQTTSLRIQEALQPLLHPTTPAAVSDRPLVTYVYSESKVSRANLVFFLAHALHDNADFVFIFNGETDAASLLPEKPNVEAVHRDNSCYDLGAHGEVLTKDGLWLKYNKYILMNASVRGPFIPTWSDSCWSERFLNKVTDEVKLVGLSLNCWPTPHVQSMVWATDREGIELLLHPPAATSPRHDEWMERLFTHEDDFPRPKDYRPAAPGWAEPGLGTCFADRQEAVEAEIAATGIVLGAGKKVEVMLTLFHAEEDKLAQCARLGEYDPTARDGLYAGSSPHPFETIFFKSNRGLSESLLAGMTEWTDKMNYSSYDHC